MRSSIIFTLTVLATATPSLAAPTSTPQYARRHTAIQDSVLDESGAFAFPYGSRGIGRYPLPIPAPHRHSMIARADDETGAWSLGSIFKAAKSAVNVWRTVQSWRPRDVDEFFGREFEENFTRELLARKDDESGAFWGAILRAAPSIISVVSRFLNKRDVGALSAREFEELLTRELQDQFSRELSTRADDESGAWGFWRKLLRAAPAIAKAATTIFSRDPELEVLFSRATHETRSLNELN